MILNVTAYRKIDPNKLRMQLIGLAKTMHDNITSEVLYEMQHKPYLQASDIRNKYRQRWYTKFYRAMYDIEYLSYIMFDLTGTEYIAYMGNIYTPIYEQRSLMFSSVIARTQKIFVNYLEGVPYLKSNCQVSIETYDNLCRYYWQPIVENKPDLLNVDTLRKYV